MIDYKDLSSTSKVWIYQSNKDIPADKLPELRSKLADFAEKWVSHQQALKAWADILEQRFFVLMVDESQAGASGCSIDKSVAFMRSLEQELDIDLFDRMNFAYKKDGELCFAQKDAFVQLYEKGEIDANTTVFNNLVQSKADFESKWQVALADSWHKNFV